MKTKLFFVMIALMGMTLNGSAQQTAPSEFTKVLEVLNRGINVRAEPSTNSKKIGSDAKYLMVLSEDAEWYHAVVLTDGSLEPQGGYVSKKVCKVRDLPALDANYINRSLPDAGIRKTVRQSGKYKGYSIFCFDRAETYTLFFGRECGNYYVGTALECIDPYEEYRFSGSDGEQSISSVRVQKSEEGMEPDWNKLSDYEIDKLLAIESKTFILLPGRMTITYRGDTEDSVGEGVNIYYWYNASGKYGHDDKGEHDEGGTAVSAPAPPSFEHDRFALKQLKYDKFVEITKDGVNIRKQPDTKSPRLVAFYDPSEECLDCPAEHRWTTRQVKAGEGKNASSKGMVMPLTGESGDWYQMFIGDINGYYLCEPGYVSKQFCNIVNKKPLRLPFDKSDEYTTFNIFMVESGKYKGLCVAIENDGFYDPTLRLGVYYDGMCIFPYSITYWESDENKRAYIDDNSLNVKMGALNKFNITTSTTILDLLMNHLDKMNNGYTTIYTSLYSPMYYDESSYSFVLPTKDVLKN